MYQFIETICYENGGFQRISLHQERMNSTRLHFFGRKDVLSLESAMETLTAADLQFSSFQKSDPAAADLQSAPPAFPFRSGYQKIKCRVTYSETIESIEFELYTPRIIRSLQLVYDDGIDYSYKYRDRSTLNALLDKRGGADEILVVKNGLITDTSYSNIVFLRDEKWFTPEFPLLSGTRRAFYLQKKLIFPLNIKPGELVQFEEARLINAMLSLEDATPIAIERIFE